jgi:F0F1-type ATP synthase assembly protein I
MLSTLLWSIVLFKKIFPMKNLILRYGIYSSLVLVVLFSVSLSMGEQDFALSEIIGYASILVSMVFVFLGIRQYREEVGDGQISFWQAFKVGIMIVLIPALTFGLIDLVYVTYINPDFIENYYAHVVEDMKASLSAEEFAIKLKDMEAEKEMFTSPTVQFFVMALTVFLIGVIASLISSFILKNDPSPALD